MAQGTERRARESEYVRPGALAKIPNADEAPVER